MQSYDMIKLSLTDSEMIDIAEALDDPELGNRFGKRLMAVRMHGLGVPSAMIATALCVSDDTVTNYIKRYRDEGLAGLLEDRYHRPASSVEPFLEVIRASFAETPVASAAEGAARIEELTGIKLSDSQACRIMKRLGLKYRKTAAFPGGGDPQMQFEFLQEEILPRLEEARNGERRVFFVDAAHFVKGAFLGMIWAFTRVLVRTGSGRQRYNVLGAVETRDHDFISVRTTGPVNAELVCELISRIDAAYPEAEITLVLDNARYQKNKKVTELAESVGIELLHLPAYSPNLNLIERVWRLVKARCLRNRYHETFKDFMGAIDEFIDSLNGGNRHLLKTLVTENFQLFDNVHVIENPKT
jgi:transposase